MRFALLVLSIFIAGNAFCQGWQVPYPANTPRASSTPGTIMNRANVDIYGNQIVTSGANSVVVPGTGATNLGKAEDLPHTSGDVGVMALSVRNTALSTPAADSDYQYLASGTYGQSLSSLVNEPAFTTGTPIRLEGAAGANGQAMFIPGLALENAIDAQFTTSGAGTFGHMKGDVGGRLITTTAPPGETWSGCSSTLNNTTPGAIKASVASNRIYVTSITCYNNSAVASELEIQDGSGGTALYRSFLTANTQAGLIWNQTFDVPLRTTSATGLFLAMTTTATSTRCCASGYISIY